MMEDREILTSADLEGRQYSYYAAMLVKASPGLTRRTLTDYQLYSEMIPYVERTEFTASSSTLLIEGGIWKFKLRSSVKFEEKGERWIRYRIVSGHFAGLEGDIFFEPMAEKGTAVYFRGSKSGDRWPPAFVIEHGAEIVFGFTARKMRSYIESRKDDATSSPAKEGKNGSEEGNSEQIPKPRPRL